MFDQISETLSSDLNNPYPSLKPVINQTLNWLHYSSDAAKAAFLSLSLPSARLIVWLVMSGRVAETSLRDYGGRERERERWHHRPLSSRLPVAIVTGCGISCWRSIRGLVQIPAMCVFLKVPDPSATWITWMITIIHTHTHTWTQTQSDGRPANTMTFKSRTETAAASSCSEHTELNKPKSQLAGDVWAVTAAERCESGGCQVSYYNMTHHHVGHKSTGALSPGSTGAGW